jgi:hypothetical protein
VRAPDPSSVGRSSSGVRQSCGDRGHWTRQVFDRDHLFAGRRLHESVGICIAGNVTSANLKETTWFTALSSQPSSPPGVASYTGDLVITTTEGSVTLRDSGLLNSGSGHYFELQEVTSGTGAYAGTTGMLVSQGTASRPDSKVPSTARSATCSGTRTGSRLRGSWRSWRTRGSSRTNEGRAPPDDRGRAQAGWVATPQLTPPFTGRRRRSMSLALCCICSCLGLAGRGRSARA